MSAPADRRSPPGRRGSVYVAILGAATLVTIIGVSSVALMRLQLRNVHYTTDTLQASAAARSGVDVALRWINADKANWRQRGDGVWAGDLSLGEATVMLEADGVGSAHPDRWMDAVTLTSTGRFGQSQRSLEVTLQAQKLPVTALGSALHVVQGLSFSSVNVTGEGVLSTDGSANASWSTVRLPAEASGGFSGSWWLGGAKSGVARRTLPDAGRVYDYYRSEGTWIPISALPLSDGRRNIERVALGPGHNPFGATNPRGIYVIDCQGQRIMIRKSRIHGTLLLLNVGDFSRITSNNHISPAVPNYPSLLIEGNMIFSGSSDPLSEQDEQINYNPPGVPYEGRSDHDMLGTYPSVIRGLVAVSGTARFHTSYNHFQGVVLASSMTTQADAQLVFEYDPIHFNDPPGGFQDPPRMVVQPESWRPVTK